MRITLAAMLGLANDGARRREPVHPVNPMETHVAYVNVTILQNNGEHDVARWPRPIPILMPALLSNIVVREQEHDIPKHARAIDPPTITLAIASLKRSKVQDVILEEDDGLTIARHDSSYV